MSDIISARCFGCGHTIKVPVGLGGKKARCPQCTNTISIPNPNDTQHEDILSDADLPEVAVDGHKFVPEEGDAHHPDAVVAEPPPQEDSNEARRRNSGTGVRRAVSAQITSSSHPRVQRSGSQPRYAGPGPAAPKAPASSNQGMIIGIVLGVVALLIVGFVVVNKDSSSKHPGVKPGKEKEREREIPKNTPQYTPEEQALIARTLEYAATVNRGDTNQVMRFYAYEPDEERKVRIRATELTDGKLTYENPQVKSVNTAGGTVTFTHGGGKEKSLQWKQVDGVWLIAEKPSP